ncbi:MAG: hypothetical protein J0I41_11170 [Filimonas sp.]|nr:hypothetical protein [Filimonas sp.]
MKTITFLEPFLLKLPVYTTNIDSLIETLRDHEYKVTYTPANVEDYYELEVPVDNYAHSNLFVQLVITIVAGHDDILKYLLELPL